MTYFTDAYADRPRTPRGELEERIRQLKCAAWADPSDAAELRVRIAELEAELQALQAPDRGSAA
jgi:hypothetical protein